jgi:hypothetical protein
MPRNDTDQESSSHHELKALAENQAALLHAHAPKLMEISDHQPEREFLVHFMHTFAELALRNCEAYAARLAEWQGWKEGCDICQFPGSGD